MRYMFINELLSYGEYILIDPDSQKMACYIHTESPYVETSGNLCKCTDMFLVVSYSHQSTRFFEDRIHFVNGYYSFDDIELIILSSTAMVFL